MGTWGWLGHGDSHALGQPHLGCGDGWDKGTAMHRDVRVAGTQGQLGLGDSHIWGSWDGRDTGTATLRDMGTARTWGQPRDVETIGIRGQPHLGTQGQLYSGMLCMGMWEQLGHGDIIWSLCPQALRWSSAHPPTPQPPTPPQRPRGTMNVLAPVRRDRVIADLPSVSGGGHTSPGVASLSPMVTPGSPFIPPPVFSEGGRPARPPRLPPHSGQCLPGAADGDRGVSPGRFGDPTPGQGVWGG